MYGRLCILSYLYSTTFYFSRIWSFSKSFLCKHHALFHEPRSLALQQTWSRKIACRLVHRRYRNRTWNLVKVKSQICSFSFSVSPSPLPILISPILQHLQVRFQGVNKAQSKALEGVQLFTPPRWIPGSTLLPWLSCPTEIWCGLGWNKCWKDETMHLRPVTAGLTQQTAGLIPQYLVYSFTLFW